ncbi:MAG: ABC transporter permease [Chloroflexi bacterium]|nr:MAG: ABC transporter permease [Chloroflexota bacterium]RLT32191.1 MAG: ABC transporter permease [Chloroflexota bacterium]
MAATPSVAEAIAEVAQNTNKKQRTLWGDAWRRFKKHRLAMSGSIVIIFLTLTVLIGPSVWTVDRDALDFAYTMSNPIPEHPLGTDELGRDMLSRALYGGRISLSVGVTAMLIAVSLGSLIGAVSGYLGGYVDEVLSFLTNLFLSLPQLPLLLLTVYLFRDSVTKVLGLEFGMFVIVVTMVGILAWMSTARIVRASFISLKQKEFVEAAVCVGVKQSSIMFKHILPNAMSPIIVAATLEIGSAILSESTLSFLGIGFPPDTPTWGRLVTDGSQYLQIAPHLPLIPAALIFVTVLSINFMGDGLRDALDPRSRL